MQGLIHIYVFEQTGNAVGTAETTPKKSIRAMFHNRLFSIIRGNTRSCHRHLMSLCKFWRDFVGMCYPGPADRYCIALLAGATYHASYLRGFVALRHRAH